MDGRGVGEPVLRRMGGSLAHRGPDGEGVYVDDAATPTVGMVSRRLAVIDVPGGAQPMSTEDGRHTIVYNGELFNAHEVRRELEARGHGFRTHCDTEVVLRACAEWGDGALDRLNGMWAFAVWDAVERRLFLARDRLGVKPLVYAQTADGFVFGSEIKAVVASGLVARELDPQALPFYLSFFAISEPHTLVRGVRRLPAGHAMSVDSAGVQVWRYWDCALAENGKRGRDADRDDVLELLDDSVRRRLVSDVPLGVLLSGGVDSGLVTALAARHLDRPVRTFTLGFGDVEADERAAAARAARAVGAEHTESEISAADLGAALPGLLAAYDEPGESLLQTAFVSGLAARDVTVALSGLGGDELFGGYPAHVVTNRLARLERVPASLRAAAGVLARALPPGSRPSRALALAAMPSDERAARRLMHQVDAPLRHDLLDNELRRELDVDAPGRHLEELFGRARGSDPLNRLLYVYVKTYLTDELLRSSDAMSMLHSLELRTPFLDYRLVERAMTVPARHKMRGGTGKILLREIAQRTLPVAIDRGKRGFAPPVGSWIRGQLAENLRDTLAPAAIRRRGVFDPAAVERLVNSCLGGNDRAVPGVLMAFCFEVWAQRWLDVAPSA
jgi:asparagine synthase (glutamine-hydrolysing)